MSTAERRRSFLLDTHTLIWLATDDGRLTKRTRRLVLEPKNDLFLSVVSVWELAIKKSLGKIEMSSSLPAFIENQTEALGIKLLDVRTEHALLVEGLPVHHRDPFDRMLIAQALHEDMTLLSSDTAFDPYATQRVW